MERNGTKFLTNQRTVVLTQFNLGIIDFDASRCEPSFILNTFQPLRCKLAHGVPFASMRPNQPRGSIIGRNRRRDTRTRTRHTCIRACVRGWQGSGPDSAPTKSHSLSLSLHFSPSTYPPLSFPSFFLSLCFSLSLSRSIVISATSLARYFIIISSLSRLAGFPANDAFPCNG